MGQAKNRGSFEERKQKAIDNKNLEEENAVPVKQTAMNPIIVAGLGIAASAMHPELFDYLMKR